MTKLTNEIQKKNVPAKKNDFFIPYRTLKVVTRFLLL